MIKFKQPRKFNEAHGFLPYDYYVSYNIEGQELFDAVQIGDDLIEIGTERVQSKFTKVFKVIDRTAKRITLQDREGYDYTLTPHTVENDLFYYKHFSTKHYLA